MYSSSKKKKSCIELSVPHLFYVVQFQNTDIYTKFVNLNFIDLAVWSDFILALYVCNSYEHAVYI